MAKITEAKIHKLKWDKSKCTNSGLIPDRQIHNDDAVQGLHVRIYPPKASGNSNKVFYLSYGPSINRKYYRIGAWGEWTLRQAREKSMVIRREYYENGTDPNQIKKHKTQERRARPTVKQLVDQYLDEKISVWSPNYTMNSRRHARLLADACGSSLAEELTIDHAKKLFLKINKETPAQAEQSRIFGAGLYNWAIDGEKVPSKMRNPFVLERSRGQKSQYRVEQIARNRVLEYRKSEATQLFDMLEDHTNAGLNYKTVAKLYLLTGFRNSELRKSRWEDVDTGERTLKNTNPKGGKKNAYKIHLCDTAYQLLGSLEEKHMKFRTGPIFPSEKPRSDGDLGTRTGWYRWDMGIADDPRMPRCLKEGPVHIHDLRRTVAIWLQIAGETVDNVTIFKGSKPKNVTEQAYMYGEEDIRKRCVLIVEKLLTLIQLGFEETMFEKFPNSETTRSNS